MWIKRTHRGLARILPTYCGWFGAVALDPVAESGRSVLCSNVLTKPIDKELADLREPPLFVLWNEPLGRQDRVCKLVGSESLRRGNSLSVSARNAKSPINAKFIEQVGEAVLQRRILLERPSTHGFYPLPYRGDGNLVAVTSGFRVSRHVVRPE